MPNTVTIACRIRNGLLLNTATPPYTSHALEIFERGPVVLAGPGMDPKGFATTVVDAEWWAAWCADNHDSLLLEKRFVFQV